LKFYQVNEVIPAKNEANNEPQKNDIVHFSDNEDNDHDNKNELHIEEDINNLVQDAVVNYCRNKKFKDLIKFSLIQENEFEFNGKQTKLTVIENQVYALEKENWVNLNEYLTINFPTSKGQNGSSGKKQKPTPKINTNTNPSIQSQIDKIKEEKQKLLNSMNLNNNNSQTNFTRSKTPTGFLPQKKAII